MLRGRSYRLAALLVLAAILSGCTMAKISGKGPIPLLLNNPPKKVRVIDHFKQQKMITFDYTGSFDVYEIIAERLAASKADAAINLTITIKSDVSTFFVNLITFGLANARTVQVEGDLVEAPEGVTSLLDSSEILSEARNVEELKTQLRELGQEAQIASVVRTENGFAILGSK